jgi:hypothetical protein
LLHLLHQLFVVHVNNIRRKVVKRRGFAAGVAVNDLFARLVLGKFRHELVPRRNQLIGVLHLPRQFFDRCTLGLFFRIGLMAVAVALVLGSVCFWRC